MKAKKITVFVQDNPAIIKSLGKVLYDKISMQTEITEQDCINYMIELVINRTYDGYTTEISTIYGQLQHILQVKIEPAPDEWDRLFNVDFFIKINEMYIGLQIKPVGTNFQLAEIFKEKAIQQATHQKFTKKFGGKVFYLYSTKVGEKKEIKNKEVIAEIQAEIERLSS